jgi:ABC-type nitrate/sulfonate/bicarbonate transport system substrate-binding protein
MYAHPDQAEAEYQKVWNTDDKSIDEILPRLIKSKYWSANGVNQAGLQTMVDSMVLVGVLDKPIDTKSLIDTSLAR